MVCKAASVLTTLSIAVIVGAQEGISLLQTQAHLHTQKESRPDPIWGEALPDPKKQSAMSGQVDIVSTETDFQCMGGKGNWVYMNQVPKGESTTDGREQIDLGEKTLNIKEIKVDNVGNLRADAGRSVEERTYTEHGPVKNEKDCFARAFMDMRCNHWAEDLSYIFTAGHNLPKVLGVWYGGSGFSHVEGFTGRNHPNCMCAKVNGYFSRMGDPGFVSVGDMDAPGMWFCQFTGEDRATPEDLEEGFSKPAKVKKTQEEKDKCAEAKTVAKASRAALKALRAKLKDARAVVKDLKAQIKAAKEDFLAKKGARGALC